MNFVAEIKKAGELYEFHLDDFTDIAAAYSQALKYATSKEIAKTEDHYIDLGTSDQYEHIRIREIKPETVVEPPVLGLPEEAGGVISFCSPEFNYLGVMISLSGFSIEHEENLYILPMQANGNPVSEMLSEEALILLTEKYLSTQGITQYEIIVPHAQLVSNDDAIRYLTDAAQTKGKKPPDVEQHEPNAKAFLGWNKELEHE